MYQFHKTGNKSPFDVDKTNCDRYEALTICVSFMVKSLFFPLPDPTQGTIYI